MCSCRTTSCGPGDHRRLPSELGKDRQVWDTRKVVIIPDNYIFTADAMANPQRGCAAEVAAERNGRNSMKWARRAYKGVCHHRAARRRAHAPRRGPASTVTATPARAGAFGQFATGIGNTDGRRRHGQGKLWMSVPGNHALGLPRRAAAVLMAKD